MSLTHSIRHSAQLKAILGGTVVAIAIGAFIFTGVGNRSGSLFGLEAHTAARVGERTVSMRSLQSAVDNLNRQSGGNSDPTQARAQVQNALNQLIETQVLLNEASTYGWTSSDIETADWIKRQEVFQDQTSKSFDKLKYQKFLKSGQMSELELFERAREAVIQEKLLSLMQMPAVIPDPILSEQKKLNQTQFKIEIAEIKVPEKNVQQLVDSSLKTYLADAKNQNTLKDLYEKRKGEFVRDAQKRVQTLLFAHKGAERAVGEAASRSENSASEMAHAALKKLTTGESFENLNAQGNDDTKAKSAKGDAGWLDKSNTDPQTAEQLARLTKDNPLSGVIQTRFGYRILRLIEERPAMNKPFEEAAPLLAKGILMPKITRDLTEQLTRDAQAILKDKPQEWDAWMGKSGLKWVAVPSPVSPSQTYIEAWGLADPLLPLLFKLKKPGDVTASVVQLGEKNCVARLVSRTESPNSSAQKGDAGLDRFVALSEQRQFMAAAQRTLLDEYAKKRLIQRNKSLMIEP